MNMRDRNAVCWCGSGKKYKHCHMNMDQKLELYRRKSIAVPSHKMIKTPLQLEGMRESSKINIEILDVVGEKIGAGMSTEDINRIVEEVTARNHAIAAPLNYEGFPKSVCTSINDEVCHGIPSPEILLQDGDIINVDVSTIYNGYFSDSSRMFCIGNVSPENRKLVDVTKECVEKGLEQVKPWGRLGDIAHAVQSHAEANGYRVVREIGGHGIGLQFHEDPWVGFTGAAGTGMVLAPGMVFTIEPMVNAGSADVFVDEDNGWTVYTDDGEWSAQWEIMVLVTEDGHEVMAY